MPRSPDERVVRDSQSTLWAAVRDGVVDSTDLSPDGKLRPSFGTREWTEESARRLRADTPFGRQVAPVVPPRPPQPPQPPQPPPPPAPLPPVTRPPLVDVNVNLLRQELRLEEKKRAASEARERALIKVVSGLCEWKRHQA